MKIDIIKSFDDAWLVLTPQSRRRAVWLSGLITIASVLETIGIGMIIPLLGSLTSSNLSLNSGDEGIVNTLIELFSEFSIKEIVILLFLLFLVKNLYLIGLNYYQSKFIFNLESELSKKLLNNYLEKPYLFFINRNSAQLIRNTIGEVSNFSHNAVAPMCSLVAELLIVLGILILLLAVNTAGTLIVVLILGLLGFLFHRQLRQYIAKWGVNRQFHEGMRLQKLQECFGAIKEIKIAGLKKQFCNDYARHIDGSCHSGQRQQTIQGIPRLFLEVIAIFALVIAVISLGESDRDLIIPMLGLYAAAAFRLMPSVNRILNALQAIRFAQPSTDILSQEFKNIENDSEEIKNINLIYRKSVIFKDIFFQYPNQKYPVFQNVNFEIQKGEMICVVGPSGAGKSTLIDILCGLLPPEKGSVLVDGENIKGKERSWYKHISYVPQEIFLIDGTLRENITLGQSAEDIDEERLREAVEICGLSELIDSSIDGLNASAGERGSKISGGQKQRIGLAREIYRDTEMLILDEATNALDVSTETKVIENISKNRLKKLKTIIWITHGLSHFKYADKIITVEDGNVIVKSSFNRAFL